jgi:hypothetical protein
MKVASKLPDNCLVIADRNRQSVALWLPRRALSANTTLVVQSEPRTRVPQRRTSTRQDNQKGIGMGNIVASEFMTVDGIMGAPGDWQAPYFDDDLAEVVNAA